MSVNFRTPQAMMSTEIVKSTDLIPQRSVIEGAFFD
jgi:hypothetical protein